MGDDSEQITLIDRLREAKEKAARAGTNVNMPTFTKDAAENTFPELTEQATATTDEDPRPTHPDADEVLPDDVDDDDDTIEIHPLLKPAAQREGLVDTGALRGGGRTSIVGGGIEHGMGRVDPTAVMPTPAQRTQARFEREKQRLEGEMIRDRTIHASTEFSDARAAAASLSESLEQAARLDHADVAEKHMKESSIADHATERDLSKTERAQLLVTFASRLGVNRLEVNGVRVFRTDDHSWSGRVEQDDGWTEVASIELDDDGVLPAGDGLRELVEAHDGAWDDAYHSFHG